MRIAIVHDWLVVMRGGEKVLEALCELYPQADIYTLIYLKEKLSPTINRMKVKTSFIQNLPLAKRHFRIYLPLFPRAIERFNLKNYDVVLSISHCVAKGVIVPKTTCHICYCLTPMRYAWAMHNEYCAKDNLNWLGRKISPFLLNYLRAWDIASLSRVNYFIALSKYIAFRIKKYYNKETTVIYPTLYDRDGYKNDIFMPNKEDFFLVVCALVPYKRVDIAIDAFNALKMPLKIVGEGPLSLRLKKKSKSNIEFLGGVSEMKLQELYQNCQALIFPGEEDLGLAPIEAQLYGKPVIAYGKGGVLETVIDRCTGLFFYEQNADSLIKAIQEFKIMEFDKQRIKEHALRFCDREGFKRSLNDFIENGYSKFRNEN